MSKSTLDLLAAVLSRLNDHRVYSDDETSLWHDKDVSEAKKLLADNGYDLVDDEWVKID